MDLNLNEPAKSRSLRSTHWPKEVNEMVHKTLTFIKFSNNYLTMTCGYFHAQEPLLTAKDTQIFDAW